MLMQLNLEAEEDVESGNRVSVRDRAEGTALGGRGCKKQVIHAGDL